MSEQLYSVVTKMASINKQRPTDNHALILTSGHDYLDAERGSCLMNTHWNTV